MSRIKKSICFIRNPQHLGQKTLGVNYAPYILTGKFPHIPAYNTYENNDKTYNTFKETHEILMGHSFKTFFRNLNLRKFYKLPINLGGDHSIAIGSVASSIKKYGDKLKVVWIDAHADLNTIEASESKNFHGMAANFLLNIEHDLPSWIKENKLNPKQLVYFGLRDLDDYEIYLINKLGIEYYDMNLIREIGFENLLDCIKISNMNEQYKVHLSLDVDSIDPILVPSTGTPVPNGLNLKEIFDIIDFYHPNMIGMDLVELNPLIGDMKQVEQSVEICRMILDYVIKLSVNKE